MKRRRRRKQQGEPNWTRAIARAQREAARNKALIEAGETFRSQKRTGPQPSPGTSDGKRR